MQATKRDQVCNSFQLFRHRIATLLWHVRCLEMRWSPPLGAKRLECYYAHDIYRDPQHPDRSLARRCRGKKMVLLAVLGSLWPHEYPRRSECGPCRRENSSAIWLELTAVDLQGSFAVQQYPMRPRAVWTLGMMEPAEQHSFQGRDGVKASALTIASADLKQCPIKRSQWLVNETTRKKVYIAERIRRRGRQMM